MSKNIIIADDTAYMRTIIRKILTEAGFIIIGEARDGQSAVKLYQQNMPDLLILNVVMPQMNGIQALKELKTWDPNAKVLMCSAMGQAPTVFSAIRHGASDFVIKPFEPKQLLEAVCRVLNLKLIPRN